MPHTWRSRIVPAADGLYRGAEDGERGELADCAMVHDDLSEAWGTVAWLRGKPEEWWLGRYPFYPEKGWPPVIGAAEIIFASDMESDLLLVETPDRWIQLATAGPWPGPCAAILDWSRREALRTWLWLPRSIRCESSAIAEALDDILNDVPRLERKMRAA
jgi:hypothetical protein